MTGVIIISLIISFLYVFLIGRFIRGWFLIPEYKNVNDKPEIKISLIIPFCNEKQILRRSFASILRLEYASSLLEVIYVNDHSDDGSEELVRSLTETHENFRLINCGKNSSGKKAALKAGADVATGNLLLFTDADCFPDARWAKTMAGYYQEKKPVMISGPVLIKNRPGFFNIFQSLEFLSLTGSGAGSFGAGDPVMCSGANLGFDRKIYLDSINNINPEVASGDDIFMMLFMKGAFSGDVHFLKSKEAQVITEPVADFAKFIHQRMRWASKMTYYHDPSILITAFIVLSENLLLLFLLFAGITDKSIPAVYIMVFLIKSFIDLILLESVSKFFRTQKLLNYFIPVQLLYPFYSVFSGIAGLLVKTRWKSKKLISLQ